MFKLPVYLSQDSGVFVLCQADSELICFLEGATKEEAEYIRDVINKEMKGNRS